MERIRFADALGSISWDMPILLLLLGTGVYFFFRLGVFPVRYAGRITLALFRKDKRSGDGAVSPQQALCTALAGTIGTGNIAGVAGAIALGGPGAIFWMWISALFGMATKYSEIVLTLLTRGKDASGKWHGGAAIALRDRFGRFGRALSAAFCVFTVAASFGIGNLVQMHTIAESVLFATAKFCTVPESAARVLALAAGLIVAALVGIWSRGAARVGRVAERIVPVMSILYLFTVGTVIVRFFDRVPAALALIVRAAFCPRSAVGAAAGIGIRQALEKGLSRGVLSNEAGLGSAPLAHVSATADSPVREGFLGVAEVFFVTMIVCTSTALALLLPSLAGAGGYRIPYGTPCGAECVEAALETVLSPRLSSGLLGLTLLFFSFSSIITWLFYGSRCAEDLFGKRFAAVYRVLFLAMLPVAALSEPGFVWKAAEVLNALMAVPNLIALLLLQKRVIRQTKRYFQRRKDGA